MPGVEPSPGNFGLMPMKFILAHCSEALLSLLEAIIGLLRKEPRGQTTLEQIRRIDSQHRIHHIIGDIEQGLGELKRLLEMNED
jgi:hypothetical protein